MIHGYHIIFGAYGFWLPNDPRGSWSEFVGAWELVRFGRSTKSIDRKELSIVEKQQQQNAKRSLKYPAVTFSGLQARAIGRGFTKAAQKSNLTIWACSILPQHVHLVIARHDFKVEYIAGLLKGEATKQLNRESSHPLLGHVDKGGGTPTPWNSRCWKVFLDEEDSIDNSIGYVEQNPEKEDKPKQTWGFVKPFTGLDPGWVTYR